MNFLCKLENGIILNKNFTITFQFVELIHSHPRQIERMKTFDTDVDSGHCSLSAFMHMVIASPE